MLGESTRYRAPRHIRRREGPRSPRAVVKCWDGRWRGLRIPCMTRACKQGERMKDPAEYPKRRLHQTLLSRPADINGVLAITAGLEICDVMCAPPSEV